MCFCFSFGLVLFGLVGLLLGHGCGKIFCLSVRKISVKPQNKRITKLPFSKRRRYLAGCWLLYFSEKNNRPNHQCLGLRTEIKRFFNQTNKDTQDLKKGKENERRETKKSQIDDYKGRSQKKWMFCLLRDPESQKYRYKNMDIKKIHYTYFKNSLLENHVEKKNNIHTKTHIQTYKEILRKSSLLKRDA